MSKETSDALVAIGTILTAVITALAIFVSWRVYKGQRLLSQRQLLIPLWEYMSTLKTINSKDPIAPDILKAVNTLELVALSVEGGMVDPQVIRRTFRGVFNSIYLQIEAVTEVPG